MTMGHRPYTDYELHLRGVLQEAIRAWPQFDTESDPVSGPDLVEWFAFWREKAIDAVYDLDGRVSGK